jgi:hypothetical protein
MPCCRWKHSDFCVFVLEWKNYFLGQWSNKSHFFVGALKLSSIESFLDFLFDSICGPERNGSLKLTLDPLDVSFGPRVINLTDGDTIVIGQIIFFYIKKNFTLKPALDMRNAKIFEEKTLWMNVDFIHLVIIDLLGWFTDNNLMYFLIIVVGGVGADEDDFELVDDGGLDVAFFLSEGSGNGPGKSELTGVLILSLKV